jgi:hypothetical protein
MGWFKRRRDVIVAAVREYMREYNNEKERLEARQKEQTEDKAQFKKRAACLRAAGIRIVGGTCETCRYWIQDVPKPISWNGEWSVVTVCGRRGSGTPKQRDVWEWCRHFEKADGATATGPFAGDTVTVLHDTAEKP